MCLGLAVFLTLKVEVNHPVNHPVKHPVNHRVIHPVNVYIKYQVKLELKHELNNHNLICALRWASAITSSFTRALCEGIFVKRKIECSLI